MTTFITGKHAVTFDGDFDKILQSFLAPYVYTKDIPEFIRLKNEYNEKVEMGEIKGQDNFRPYCRLDFIEIETCKFCGGSGCASCFGTGWNTVK